MKKIYIIIIILCFIILLSGENQLARLHYSGGGDWYNDTDAIPNLVEYLNKTISTDLKIEEATVKPADAKLFDYPFLFLTGHGKISFNDRDIDNLREYLLRGGFLYADDDYGMDASFRKEIKKLFPARQLIEIPKNHELFHSYFDFNNGLPKIHKHDDKRPQAFAIFDDNGRIMVLYTFESNISDGWSNAHDDPKNIKELAFKMGANIFCYLMTK